MSAEPSVKAEPRCEGCGYSLSGLGRGVVAKCPECGGEIDWARVEAGGGERPRPLALPLLLAVGPHVVAIAGLNGWGEAGVLVALGAWLVAIPCTLAAIGMRGAYPATFLGRMLLAVAIGVGFSILFMLLTIPQAR